MKAKRGLICLMMSMLMVTGFLFGFKTDASAASSLPNFAYKNGIASWDYVEGADKYAVYISGLSGYTAIEPDGWGHNGCCTYRENGVTFNFQKMFEMSDYDNGTYELTFYAMKNGERLDYENKVEFNFVSDGTPSPMSNTTLYTYRKS